MPVYHFIFHAYGSWLPDQPKGFHRRQAGWQPSDKDLTKTYRQQMTEPSASLDDECQSRAVRTLIESQDAQRFTLYAIAADHSHLHVVVGWNDDRDPKRVRTQLKTSMTRALNRHIGRRKWFARNAGQTPVQDEDHLYEIVHHYLPKHRGQLWTRSQGSIDVTDGPSAG